jgi:hypothetical protein
VGFNQWISKIIMLEISNFYIRFWYRENNVKGCFKSLYFHILALAKFG